MRGYGAPSKPVLEAQCNDRQLSRNEYIVVVDDTAACRCHATPTKAGDA